MMADNIEHVISYWVLFQRFHSPALGGFAVISHWVPYLFLAGFSGALADRFDIRRLIQVGMLLFMAVSVSWGLMFLTHSETLWMAMLLLVDPRSGRGHLDSGVAGADSPNRHPGAVAERGAHQCHRTLPGLSGRSGRRRGLAAGVRTRLGHLRQCADLRTAVRVADQRAVRVARAGLRGAAAGGRQLRRHMVDHAGGGAQSRCCCP